MKVLLLSRYGRLGASSRLRLFQYIPYLEEKGIEVTVNILLDDDYIKDLYAHRKVKKIPIIKAYLRRMLMLLKSRKYDLLWIEKELFPWLPAWAEGLLSKIGIKYIVDYDDAIFHNYDLHRFWLVRKLLGKKIDKVMRHSSLVIVCNDYLAKRSKSAGAKKIELVPTVINLDRYHPITKKIRKTTVIGWIGSPATENYLLELVPVFENLKKRFEVKFLAVGVNPKSVKNTPIEVIQWTEENEVDMIKKFDIGIMPLPNGKWEQGKCGYKLVQYMACGLPVVASPVGVNNKIVKHEVNGYLAGNLQEWEQALSNLINNPELRKRMGNEGRKRTEEWYSLQVQAPRLESLLRSVVKQ